MSKTIEKYEALTQETKADINAVILNDSISDYNRADEKKELTQEKIDSIKKDLDEEMKKSFIPIPEVARKKIIEEVEKEAKDTVKKKKKGGKNISFGGETRLDQFSDYIKNKPDTKIDTALDSLGYEKNFTNRFLFTRAKTMYSLSDNEDKQQQFYGQVLSYSSIALFLLLPFFTLSLKFFYIRRKFTYVDHLIFVFHTQTVFFMLFSIFLLLKLCKVDPSIWIFICLFLLYLYLAMKKFYQQGYFKTFLKLILVNISYFTVSAIGASLVFLVSFALF